MKKILVVLALLFACGMAFSVTGNVHVRLNANGTMDEGGWGATLVDISQAGRNQTGFSINFDTFGFNYIVRAALGAPGSLSAAYGSFNATSPGYFQVTGLKLGNIGLGIGGSIWHFDETRNQFQTNGATTNNDLKANVAFNRIAVNAYFSIPLSDTMTLQQVPWDQMQLDIGMGSATRNNVGVTNVANHSLFAFDCPLYLNMSLDKLSLTIFDRFHINTLNDNDSEIGSTNSDALNNFINTTIARIGYPLNDQWSFYAHVGVTIGSSTETAVVAQAQTNVTVTSTMEIPIFVGLKFQPAGWSTFNLGIGYVVANDVNTLNQSGSTKATNVTTTGGGLVGIYHNNSAEEHAYQQPILNWGGSAKFASDWTLAFTGQMLLNASSGFGSIPGYFTATSSTGTGTQNTINNSQLIHFDNFWNWDAGGAGAGACYIQYAKDAVSMKFVMGGNGTGGQSIMGMFGFVDLQINF